MIQEILEQYGKILTGSRDLNLWLEGGYEKGIITLLYGQPASGKSNFVLLASAQNAKLNNKILFIDTEGSFSVERLKQISGSSIEQILKNIIILKPINFSEQKRFLYKLSKQFKSENIGLIIVDSMTMLYRLELANARKLGFSEIQQVNSDLARQLKILHEIAILKNIPILITGQVYSEFLTEEERNEGKKAGVNLVGGDILKYWCKCIIQLEVKNGKRRAIIRKHRSMPENSLNFEIISQGIRKKRWF